MSMSICPNDLLPTPNPPERRRAERLRVTALLPVHIGRGEGAVVDLSLGGAKIRHSVGVRRGGRTRLTVYWQNHQLSLNCEVLASRLVDLGTAETPALYETRLRFVEMKHEQLESLARLVAALRTRDLRRLVSNMNGWNESHDEPGPMIVSSGYLRLTRNGNSWRRTFTSKTAQPPDGFLIPAATDEKEVELMCQTYEKLDDDGRHLLRRMAAAAVEGA